MTTESSGTAPRDPEDGIVEKDRLLVITAGEPLTAEQIRELRLADQR